jgi:hypothetical protein
LESSRIHGPDRLCYTRVIFMPITGNDMIPDEGIMCRPHWVEAKDNLARVCAFHCGCVDRCKFVVGAWVVMPSCIWLRALEVLVTGPRDYCVGIVDVVLIL